MARPHRQSHDGRLPKLFTARQWAALAERFGLSERQALVAQMLCAGLGNKRIARAIYRSEYTVDQDLRTLYRALEVDGRVGVVVKLVVTARRLRWRTRASVRTTWP